MLTITYGNDNVIIRTAKALIFI